MTSVTRCTVCNEWTQGFHLCGPRSTATPLKESRESAAATSPKPRVRKPRTPSAPKPRTYVRAKGTTPKAQLDATKAKRDAEMVRMYGNGASVAAIATLFNVHDTTVRLALRQAGVPRRNPKAGPAPVQRTPEDIAKAVAMYEDGATFRDIQHEMHWTSKTVRTVMHATGITIRPSGSRLKRARPEQAARVVAAYKAGATTRDIAKQEGTSAAVIARWLAENGVTTRPGPAVYRHNREQVASNVHRLRDEGLSIRRIATRLGISVSTVERMLRETRAA